MPDRSMRGSWAAPEVAALRGQHVTIARLDPEADIKDLYALSHGTAEFERLWTYLWYGPFADKSAMHQWLASIKESRGPLFYQEPGWCAALFSGFSPV
jgi:hypothetical protein